MVQGVQRGVPKTKGVLDQSTNVVQATAGYPTSPVLGPGAEANLLCQQSIAGARGEIQGHRESSPGSSVLSAKTSPLLLELHRNSDDRPSHSQGLTETKCGRKDDAMCSRAIRV